MLGIFTICQGVKQHNEIEYLIFQVGVPEYDGPIGCGCVGLSFSSIRLLSHRVGLVYEKRGWKGAEV